jgi:hypothetical protein
MKGKRPKGIWLISILTILSGLYILYNGWTIVGAASAVAGVGMDIDVGGILSAIGLMLIVVAALLFIMAFGLLMMAEWARRWGSEFYGLMAILAFFLAIFNYYLVLSGVIYLIFYLYLRSSKTKAIFEGYGYETPRAHVIIAARYQAHQRVEPSRQASEHRAPHPQKSLVVPENMVLCPQCQTLNMKHERTCRMCATDLTGE